ncbi:MAG: Na(+)/H(+) antiporter subunit B [Bdellovibrionia bacterium]
MNILQALILIFVCLAATAVVLVRDPLSQSVGLSFYGILLGLMFFVFHAPDVALSQIVIGAIILPMLLLLALSWIKRSEHASRKDPAP